MLTEPAIVGGVSDTEPAIVGGVSDADLTLDELPTPGGYLQIRDLRGE